MRISNGLLLVATLCASCSTTSNHATTGSVNALEEEWNRSRIAGDARAVANLLDDRWTMIHVDGRVEGKQSYVAGIASGARQIQIIDVRERQVQIFGNVAVVTGEAHQRGFRRGELREGRLRFTHVWVRSGSTWRMVLSQSTEITASQ